jgi:hypothetical protein
MLSLKYWIPEVSYKSKWMRGSSFLRCNCLSPGLLSSNYETSNDAHVTSWHESCVRKCVWQWHAEQIEPTRNSAYVIKNVTIMQGPVQLGPSGHNELSTDQHRTIILCKCLKRIVLCLYVRLLHQPIFMEALSRVKYLNSWKLHLFLQFLPQSA